MRALYRKTCSAGLVIFLLLAAGCIVSGTFIIVDDFVFTAQSGFYFYQVDITQTNDWKENKDKIDFVDVVGFEFYITSTEETAVTFNAYIDEHSGADFNPDSASLAAATLVLSDLTVPPGSSKITYAESLKHIQNLDFLKTLAKEGKFDYYGTSTGNVGGSFVIDSAKVIVTFSAG